MSGYLEAIRWALRLFPAAAAVLTAAYVGYSRRRYGSVQVLRLMVANSYYNKFGQEHRAASPVFFPSRA